MNRPRIAAMSFLEDVKRITEKTTGWKRPDNPQDLLRERKPQTYRLKDDGLIPNHPKWPLVIYKNAVRLPEESRPRRRVRGPLRNQRLGKFMARWHLRLCSLPLPHP